MPTAGWLRRVDLPVDAAGRSYIDPPNLDQILDQFLNWRGNVNGGGYVLSNVVLDAAIKTAGQTPWLSNVDAAQHTLSNLISIQAYKAGLPSGAGSNFTTMSLGQGTPNYDELRFYCERGSTGDPAGWDSNAWIIKRLVDGTSICSMKFGATDVGFEQNVNPRANVTFLNTGGPAGTGKMRLRLGPSVGFLNSDLYPYVEACSEHVSQLAGLAFGTYDGALVERMRITYQGNVGIGTATPTFKLDVAGAVKITGVDSPGVDNFVAIILQRPYTSDGDAIDLLFRHSDGTTNVGRMRSVTTGIGVSDLVFYTQGDVEALRIGTGVVKIRIGNVLKTLSVDGSGFVKAA